MSLGHVEGPLSGVSLLALQSLTEFVSGPAASFNPDQFLQGMQNWRKVLPPGHASIPMTRLWASSYDLKVDGELTRERAESLLSETMAQGSVAALVPGYEILELIGRGGSSHIYRGVHSDTGEDVAIKVANAGMGLAARRHIANEFRYQSQIDSPSVARAYENGIIAERRKPYLVLEYMSFRSLDAFIESVTTWDLRERLELGLKTILAVAELHKREIIHNDIKPGNVLLNEDGEVKLTDFALATGLEEAQKKGSGKGYRGTFAYKGVETGDTLRTDVDALGRTMYYILTGEHPKIDNRVFAGFAELQRRVQNEILPPSSREPRIPKRVDDFVMKAMHLNPVKRFEDATVMATALSRILNSPKRRRSARV